VIDPDPDGDPPVYLLDYNYLRKQQYDPVQVLTESMGAGTDSEPPLCKTYAVKSQTGVLAVFKPELTSVDIGGGLYRWVVNDHLAPGEESDEDIGERRCSAVQLVAQSASRWCRACGGCA
jgi:hypothetical protein